MYLKWVLRATLFVSRRHISRNFVLSSKPQHIISLDQVEGLIVPKEVLLDNSEQELVAACRRGERSAQKRVYELFSGRMINICKRYTKDADQAQDLMHDGFIKVFMNIKSFKGQSSLQTWITRIMINNCISAIRKDLKRGIQVQVENVPLKEEEPDYFEEPRGITAKQVFQCLQDLPLGYKTVFSLYVLDGYSHREISEELGVSEGTSKSQLSKAKRMLAKMLRELS